MGISRVRITHTGSPLIVALCAYDPVRWIVDVEPQVQLKKVILTGYYQQQIEGLPDGIPVEGRLDAGRRFQLLVFCRHAARGPSGVRASEGTDGLCGQDLCYIARIRERLSRSERAITWSAQMTLYLLDSLYEEAMQERWHTIGKELVGHSFTDVVCTPDRNGHDFRSDVATHSVFGPYASTMRPLDLGGIEFAIDPRGPSFFGWSHGVVTIDPQSGSATPWPVVGLDGDPWDTQMAFDTKRNRLLLWGRQELVAVDIFKKEAVQVRKGKPNIVAMTYSAADDLLYACCAALRRRLQQPTRNGSPYVQSLRCRADVHQACPSYSGRENESEPCGWQAADCAARWLRWQSY